MRYLAATAAALVMDFIAMPAVAEPAAMWGGFGHATVSGQFGTFGDLAQSLRRDEALGQDFTLNDMGATFGGGGKALIAGTLILGGKGYGWLVPSSPPDELDVSFGGGGGGFDIGIAAFNQDHFLLYPYVGGLGIGMEIEVSNNASRDVVIGGDVLPPGQTRSYTAGFAAAEFGIGFQRFLFFGDSLHKGGFMVGAEAGFLTTIVAGDWTAADSESELAGLGSFGFSGGFVRLTLGGGGFSFDDGQDDEEGEEP